MLFDLISTTWGIDEQEKTHTTFRVPDLRGSFLRGIGNPPAEVKANEVQIGLAGRQLEMTRAHARMPLFLLSLRIEYYYF